MGGGDKTLLQLGGRTLLSRVLQRVTQPGDDVALSANGDPLRFAAYGLSVLTDAPAEHGRLGPLAGVLAGMTWASRLGHAALVTVPGDCPFLPLDLVSRLDTMRRQHAAAVVCALSGGRRHHVTALWDVSLEAPLRRALGRGVRRIQDFTSSQAIELCDFEPATPDPFLNLNTPDELAAAETWLSGS